jgi:hypothetical protein
MRDRLHAYLGGIARENGMTALAVGGVSDPIHYDALPGANDIASESCSIAKSRIFEVGQQKLSGKGKILLAEGTWSVLYRSVPTRQDGSLHLATTRTSQADQL